MLSGFSLGITNNSFGHAIFWTSKKLLDFVKSNRGDSKHPPKYLQDFVGGGDFDLIGKHCINIFEKYIGLKHDYNILDIGCGSGRLAIPLTQVLDSGHYEGIDIFKDCINWCKDNITKNNPNFSFQHIDIKNTTYNPGGKIDASEFKFPFNDNSFDFCFATSLFTHMLPFSLINYVKEINRVIKPQKKCLLNFYIFNEYSFELIKQDKTTIKFIPTSENFLIKNPENPEEVVAYKESFIKKIISDSGFIIDSLNYGSWSGQKNLESGQDFVIIHKE